MKWSEKEVSLVEKRAFDVIVKKCSIYKVVKQLKAFDLANRSEEAIRAKLNKIRKMREQYV